MPATSSNAHSAVPHPDRAGTSQRHEQTVSGTARRGAGVAAGVYGDQASRTRSASARPVERSPEQLSQPRFHRTAQPHVEPLTPITAAGGAVVALVTASLAAILDGLISPGVGVLFGFVFVLCSVLVALRMCWYDAWAAVALPPLVYIVAVGVSSQVAPMSAGGWLHRTSTDMAIAVLDHPVYLLLGTALAALAMLHRARVE